MIIIIFDEETNKYNLLLLFGSLFSVYIQWFFFVYEPVINAMALSLGERVNVMPTFCLTTPG